MVALLIQKFRNAGDIEKDREGEEEEERGGEEEEEKGE